MSYGTEAGSGAADAGGAAANAGNAAGLYGNMADVSGTATPAANGFEFGSSSPNMPTSGPTVDAANIQTYGTKDPPIMQQMANMYDRFQKGGNQNLLETYKNFGNNPETYGAVLSKFSPMGGKGGSVTAAPITINNTNQQAENTYLKRRGY